MATIKLSVKINEDVFSSFQPDQLTEEHGDIYETIGRIIALWNRIEFKLTYLADWLHPAFKSELPSDRKRPPRGLEAKLGLLRHLVAEYNELSVFKDDVERLFGHIDAVKDDRHKLVHWCMHRFEATDRGLKLIVTNPEKMTLPWETYEMDKESLLDLARKLGVIGLMIGNFTTSFQDHIHTIIKEGKNSIK